MKDVTLVLVALDDGTESVFKAPAYTYFDHGDLVLVDTCRGTEIGKVVCSFTTGKEDDEYTLITHVIKSCGDFRKVLAKLAKRELVYKEETEETDLNE